MGNLGGTLMPVLLDGYGRRFHLSDTAAGVVAAAQLLSTALVALLLSRQATRPGRVALARWGLAVAAAGFCGAGQAHDVAVLLAANAVAGAGLGAAFAASAAGLAALRDSERAAATTVFGSTVVLALLLAGVPQADHRGGAAAGFAVLAGCCAAAWWLMRYLPDGQRPHPGPHPSAGGQAPPWWFIASVAVLAATDQGAWSYAGVLGERHAGLSAGAVSVILAVAGAAALVGVPVSAAVARRLGRVPTLVLVIAADAVAKLLAAASGFDPLYAAATVVWQICYLALLAQMLGVVAAVDRSGRWAAAAGGALAVGTGLGPAMTGWLLDTAGAPVLGGTLAAVTVVAAAPLLRTVRGLALPADSTDA
ncbi:MFS transporter [Streptomyces sp. BBFR115]|uniref:MFS transporter n=1 Tax=Streptomyces sp. BBFR115 TaxID=3448173 RepID=UPI003F7590F4